jgi:hypothetical protein
LPQTELLATNSACIDLPPYLYKNGVVCYIIIIV